MKINRRAYLLNNVFEVWLAVAALFSGLSFFLFPSYLAASPVGRAIRGPIDDLWSITYAVSGLLVLIGLAWPRLRIELVGLLLFATAVAANTVAVIDLRGFTQSFSLVAITVAILARALAIWRVNKGDQWW